MMNFESYLVSNPRNLFVVFATLFSVLIIVLTPPFSVPDEDYHFYRAYKVSEGNFFGERKNNRVGGEVPVSVQTTVLNFEYLKTNPIVELSLNDISSQLNIELNESQKIFVDFPHMSYYPGTAYFPQAIGIFIGRMINAPPIVLMYLGRIFAAFFWILIVVATFKNIPVNLQWLWMVVMMVPMAVCENSSLSADAFTNTLAFLVTSYFIRYMSKSKITFNSVIILSSVLVILTISKLVYLPIVLIFIAVIRSAFISNKKRGVVFLLIIVLPICAALFWNSFIHSIYVGYDGYNSEFVDNVNIFQGASIEKQIDYISNNFIEFIQVFYNSLDIENTFSTYIFHIGYLYKNYSVFMVGLWFLTIVLAVISTDFKISTKQRLMCLVSVISVYVLVVLSQYLTWCEVGCKSVYSTFGRYFIPVGIILLLSFLPKKSFERLKKTSKYISIITILISIFYTSNYLYGQFYSELEIVMEFKCTTEVIDENRNGNFIENGRVFKGADQRTNKYSHSGNYSVMLDGEKSKYAFTTELQDIRRGEAIEVSYYSKSKNSSELVIFSGENFYQKRKFVDEYTDTEWQLVRAPLVFSEDIDMLAIYIWNTEKDTVYLDDFKIKKIKRK